MSPINDIARSAYSSSRRVRVALRDAMQASARSRGEAAARAALVDAVAEALPEGVQRVDGRRMTPERVAAQLLRLNAPRQGARELWSGR